MVHHQSELYEHGSPSARCVRILGFALTAATMGKALRKPRHAAKSASTSGSSLLTMAVAMAVAAILAGGAVLYWTQSKPTTPVEAIGSMVGLEPGMKAPPFEGMITQARRSAASSFPATDSSFGSIPVPPLAGEPQRAGASKL